MIIYFQYLCGVSPSHESGLGGKSAKPCVLLLSLSSEGAECAGPNKNDIMINLDSSITNNNKIKNIFSHLKCKKN